MIKKSVCFYFEVHQPWRLTKLNILDIGKKFDLFIGHGQNTNEKVFKKVAEKCYYPVNSLLLKMLKKYPEFCFSFSITGTFIDSAKLFEPKLLKNFKSLIKTNRIELIDETYYHSLSWLFSKLEFANQIKLHRSQMWKLFKKRPVFFRNTELIYNNEIANFIKIMGFEGIFAEGWNTILKNKSANHVYNSKKCEINIEDRKIAEKFKISSKNKLNIKLLLKNFTLSDDIAFRFSNKEWSEFPLTAEKFANWIELQPGETFNIFIDYETFGEHQWESTGIFNFLFDLPKELLKRNITFRTPSQTIKQFKSEGEIDAHSLMSWADESRDLSAWTGNNIQDSALKAIYQLEEKVKKITSGKTNTNEKAESLEIWRRLQTSDHFYYMCTKYWSDGDVHKYFSPYDSPYYAYINYMNCLNDYIIRLEEFENRKK